MTKQRYPVEYTTQIVCSNYTAVISIKAKNEKELAEVIEKVGFKGWKLK